MDITTIKISKETRERLGKLKEYERETFNEVLDKIFYILNTLKKDPAKAQRALINIDRRIKRQEIMKKIMKSSSSKSLQKSKIDFDEDEEREDED